MRKWIRGWNPREKDGTWEDEILVERTGQDEDGILVEKMGQGRMESSWKGRDISCHFR